MLSDTQATTHPGPRPEAQACEVPSDMPYALACGLACARANAHCDARFATRPNARADIQGLPQGSFCEKGLSALQINVLALAHRAGTRVTPYSRIARQLASEFGMPQQAESVRGAVNRLAARGFLRHQQARDGTIRGVRFTIIEERLCSYIVRPLVGGLLANLPDTRPDTQADAQPEHFAAPSILEEIDRKKNLSISSEKEDEQKSLHRLEALTEEDLTFHWPELSRQGFGTDQIRQIINRLAQVNIGTGRIIQGLTHAEWELGADRMRDKSGNAITSPVSWVFKILATQGYYPRPEGYRSPQEQAEVDTAEELKRQTAAYEARQTAEADAWILKLSPEERNAVIGPPGSSMRIPDEVILRRHFRSEIWPQMQHKEFSIRDHDREAP